MVPLERWDDYRLDDLARKVDRMIEPVESVAVLRAEMRGFGQSVDALHADLGQVSHVPKAIAVLTVEVKSIAQKVDDLVGKPAFEARQTRAAIRTALISAVVSSLTLVVASLLLGGPVK